MSARNDCDESFDVEADAAAHYDEVMGHNLPLAVRAARARRLSAAGVPVVEVRRREPDS